MIPLLALGLFGANALANDYFKKSQQDKLTEGTAGLLGTAEGARAGEEGPVQIPGSGLLADPSNIQNQLKFAQGLLAMPGGAKALQSFAPMLGQAIQSKQFEQGQQQQASQFDRTDARLGNQFDTTRGDTLAHQDQQQQNWKATFDAQAAQNAFARQMEGARLALSQQAERRQAAAANDKGDGGPKLPVGYGTVQTASGLSLMPLPGTENYGKAKAAEGTLTNTIDTIDSLMNDYLGKEVQTPGGNTKREGGMGSELWGPGYTQMNAKRGSIIAALGTAREMGVLDKNEYERLTKQLPEVDELTRSDKSFAAAYKGVRDEFSRKLQTHRQANPWLVPPPPPGYH